MARNITLKRFEVQNENFPFLGAFRLRVEASDPDGLADAGVFLWRRDPPNPYNGTIVDTFFAICSPVDLEEYPLGAPNPQIAYPFFRQSFCDLILRATSQAIAVWGTIQKEVCELLDALDRLDKLVLVETLRCQPFDGSLSRSESIGAR